MTLKELYDNAKKQPKPLTPSYAFVLEVARVTKRSEITVRKWIAGDAIPDALTQETLARHFKTSPEALFPKV